MLPGYTALLGFGVFQEDRSRYLGALGSVALFEKNQYRQLDGIEGRLEPFVVVCRKSNKPSLSPKSVAGGRGARLAKKIERQHAETGVCRRAIPEGSSHSLGQYRLVYR